MSLKAYGRDSLNSGVYCLSCASLLLFAGTAKSATLPDVDLGVIGNAGGGSYWQSPQRSPISRFDAYSYVLGGIDLVDVRDQGEFIIKAQTVVGGHWFISHGTNVQGLQRFNLGQDIFVLNSLDSEEISGQTIAKDFLLSVIAETNGLSGTRRIGRFDPGTYYFVHDSAIFTGESPHVLYPVNDFGLQFEPFRNVVDFSTTVAADGPRWNAPGSFETGDVGFNTHYSVLPFHVSATGLYSAYATSANFREAKYLFGPGFDPTSSSNFHRWIDRNASPQDDVSGTLSSGVQYYLVVAGWYPSDAGDFSGFFTSDAGVVTFGIVPEPSTLSLLGLAAGMLLLSRRPYAKP